ncbi:MAG TPA: GTPase HflX [Terriglobales bacterium]|nr:GTPase HflX [Terriglobales bacterium]
MESAFLVGVEFTDGRAKRTVSAEDSLAELDELTRSAGGAVAGELLQRRPRPDAATLIGGGKLEELKRAVAASRAELVIFDCELTATQQRNLERAVEARVLARTQLILDIFARHARTREGQLQVELAQLEYLLPRLAGRGHAMSRLGGGIGTRGPGETQLETDRRRIHQRIAQLTAALEKVREQRGQQRRQRERVPLATAALVGYTNAGKSTLFNRLTGSEVLTSGRMFATLDPTVRILKLPGAGGERRALLSDTVGFLRDLPHGLINAFRATLEEVTRASLLLVVVDASSPERNQHQEQVQRVLAELEVEAAPQLLVWNKADLPEAKPGMPAEAVPVSAKTGAGIPELLKRMAAALPAEPMEEVRLRVPHAAGAVVHWVHERGEVVSERHTGQEVVLVARVPRALLARVSPYRVGQKRRRAVENA